MNSISLRYKLLEDEKNFFEKVKRRNLRDASNPLYLSEAMFQQHYRVSKVAFKYLLDILEQNCLPDRKSSAIASVVKLAACLRFFAEGSYQKGVGRQMDIGVAQSTFSEVLSEVLTIFENKLCPRWICWPNIEEQKAIAREFFEKYRFPGVIGCIDGTHVRIISPQHNKHLFYNRKGFNSLNVMLISDNKTRIRFVDAVHGGACHDSSIWNSSELRSKMEDDYLNGQKQFWLLGDAGYPLEPWLLTPHRTPSAGSNEMKFNETHSRVRNVIERTNGILKNRWRCLLGARELHYSPKKAIQIINVCCALHNLCYHYGCNDSQLSGTIDESDPIEDIDDNVALESSYNSQAVRIRLQIGNSL